MSKRSTNPWYIITRIRRQMLLLELKHKFAMEDGNKAEAARLTRKAEGLMERLSIAKSMATLELRRDHASAIKENERRANDLAN